MSKMTYIGLSIVYAAFVLVVGVTCYKKGSQDSYEATKAFYTRLYGDAKTN